MTGALDGYRVVEFSEGCAGPMIGRLLGDAGADVVKVEGPDGDRARDWGPEEHEGTSIVFQVLNRNKRSVVVEEAVLDSPVTQRLLAEADVLIVDNGQLDVDAVMTRYPRLVVCVVSSWGPEGPWSDLPGGELPAQLSSESTSSLGRIGEEPVRLGTELGSMHAAVFGFQGVLAALLAIDEVGAQRVDVSLFGSLLRMRTTMWAALSNPDVWRGFHLDSYIKPPEHGYTSKDRLMYLTVGRVEDPDEMFRALKMEFAMQDPRYPMLRNDRSGGMGDYSHLTHDLWDRGLSQFSYDEAKQIIESHGGWVFPCLDFQGMIDDEHVRLMNLFIEYPDAEGKIVRDVRPPWILSDTPASVRRPAPRLGEHTDSHDRQQ
jgi:crotonobetainyl-CoA:carnitine CoA-transferase CaiB-like acyl-CoA transferase